MNKSDKKVAKNSSNQHKGGLFDIYSSIYRNKKKLNRALNNTSNFMDKKHTQFLINMQQSIRIQNKARPCVKHANNDIAYKTCISRIANSGSYGNMDKNYGKTKKSKKEINTSRRHHSSNFWW